MRGKGSEPERPSQPGWYPDPWSATGTGERYFDGKRWGSSERPQGRHTTVAAKPARAARSGSRRSRSVVSIVILVMVVGGYWYVSRANGDGGGSEPQAASSEPSDAAASNAPPAGVEESSRPLGTPAPPPAGVGGFEVLRYQPEQATTPVAFDPCRPIHYVVNLDDAPADGLALVQSGIERVSLLTGLQFVYDGTTSEPPAKDRASYLPKTYPNRWAPVLIAWTDEGAFPSLAGYIAGSASPKAVYAPDGRLVYVSGVVVLDRDQLAQSAKPDRDEVRATVLHELGHLVGLDHTADRNQLMFSEAQRNLHDFGDGDRRGLALLGTQDCFPGV